MDLSIVDMDNIVIYNQFGKLQIVSYFPLMLANHIYSYRVMIIFIFLSTIQW